MVSSVLEIAKLEVFSKLNEVFTEIRFLSRVWCFKYDFSNKTIFRSFQWEYEYLQLSVRFRFSCVKQKSLASLKVIKTDDIVAISDANVIQSDILRKIT